MVAVGIEGGTTTLSSCEFKRTDDEAAGVAVFVKGGGSSETVSLVDNTYQHDDAVSCDNVLGPPEGVSYNVDDGNSATAVNGFKSEARWYAGKENQACNDVCSVKGLECQENQESAITTETKVKAVALEAGIYGGMGCTTVLATTHAHASLLSVWYRTVEQTEVTT